MPKKRIVITSEFVAVAEIDHERVASYYDGDVPSDAQLENSLARSIEGGDRSVRGVLEGFGVPDTVSPYEDACCEVSIQEECQRHPGEWKTHNDRCSRCIAERIGNGSAHP